MNECSCSGLCTNDIELFSSLAHDLQHKISASAIHTNRKKGEVIINEGDDNKSIFLIRDGRVKLSKFDFEGKEYIQDIMVKGDSVGEDLFLSSEPFPYTIVCVTDVKLCEIKKETFIDLIASNPDMAINLMHSLSEKLKRSNEKNLILQENDATRRLANFILDRHERTNGKIELTIDDIAASINLRRETVSRKIKQLVNDEVLERVGQSGIKVLDSEKLKFFINFI